MSLPDYLRDIGIAGPLIAKMGNLKRVADSICPETIEDFFVSEYKQSDGQRIYESLFFFSPKYVMESKKIMSSNPNIDIACLYRNIDRYEMMYNNYNPAEPRETTDNSILQISGIMGDVLFFLQASGENCARLWEYSRNM